MRKDGAGRGVTAEVARVLVRVRQVLVEESAMRTRDSLHFYSEIVEGNRGFFPAEQPARLGFFAFSAASAQLSFFSSSFFLHIA